MQVTSASTRTVFRDMGCGHGEGVDGSPPVVRPKKIANVDRLLCGGAIYSNLGPLFMPALVYSFRPEDDRCMWIRTIASCVCSSRDHLEYVSLVLLGGFHGLVSRVWQWLLPAISPRYTLRCLMRICHDFPTTRSLAAFVCFASTL